MQPPDIDCKVMERLSKAQMLLALLLPVATAFGSGTPETASASNMHKVSDGCLIIQSRTNEIQVSCLDPSSLKAAIALVEKKCQITQSLTYRQKIGMRATLTTAGSDCWGYSPSGLSGKVSKNLPKIPARLHR